MELFLSDSNDLRRYSLDTHHYTLLVDNSPSGAKAMDFDIREEKVYWRGTRSKNIFRFVLNMWLDTFLCVKCKIRGCYIEFLLQSPYPCHINLLSHFSTPIWVPERFTKEWGLKYYVNDDHAVTPWKQAVFERIEILFTGLNCLLAFLSSLNRSNYSECLGLGLRAKPCWFTFLIDWK